jgi:hypothetical protein
MFRRLAGAVTLSVSLLTVSSYACLTMGTNFWSLSWGWGPSHYCTGGVWGNWSPTFISQLQTYSVLRTMDWNSAYCAMATTWANRTQKSAGDVQSTNWQKAIAYEWQIDLVNHVPGCGWWLCVPVGADSEYVTNLAALTHSLLGPGRKVYLEYGNETWWEPNITGYVSNKANTLGIPITGGTVRISNSPLIAADAIYVGHGYLACQMWHWFRKSWAASGGDTTLIMRVLAGMNTYGSNGNPAGECKLMLYEMSDPKMNPWKEKCDFFCIATYMSCNSPTADGSGGIKDHYDACQLYGNGAKLVSYEGGPGGPCDTTHIKSYLAYLAQYTTIYNQYTHSGGQWGAVENGYFAALTSWAKSNPSCNGVVTSTIEPYRIAVPERTSSQTIFSLVNNSGIYGIDGRRVETQSAKNGCYVVASPKSGYGLVMNMSNR